MEIEKLKRLAELAIKEIELANEGSGLSYNEGEELQILTKEFKNEA